MPFGEIMFEAGKTAIQWMPPHINDFRLRQHQVDEAGDLKIVGKLVGEERRPGFSQAARRPQILFAKPMKVVTSQALQQHRPVLGTARAVVQVLHKRREHAQLAECLDLRMR